MRRLFHRNGRKQRSVTREKRTDKEGFLSVHIGTRGNASSSSEPRRDGREAGAGAVEGRQGTTRALPHKNGEHFEKECLSSICGLSA